MLYLYFGGNGFDWKAINGEGNMKESRCFVVLHYSVVWGNIIYYNTANFHSEIYFHFRSAYWLRIHVYVSTHHL